MTQLLQQLFEAVLAGQDQVAEAKVREAIEDKISPEQILEGGLVGAMTEVGKRFERGELYVPEMLMSARAMQAGMALLKPLLMETEVQSAGLVILGTVNGDLHDIGKNLVAMMLEGAGFQIVDLGANVAPARFVEAVKEHKPNILGMSAMLTTTMPGMEGTIRALGDEGIRQELKVMIGGAPVTQDFADNIGADGFAPDASRAAALAKRLTS
jgi:5-methyltetrahydrofolate--homocysteine methyltransferase